MRLPTFVIAFAIVLGTASQAHAVVLAPGWGYAEIDDRPFNDPGSGALLGATQAFPRGRIKDLGTPDGSAVRLTVFAFSAAGKNLFSYSLTERHAVYTPFDRRIDVNPSQISYLRYDFCRTTSPAQCTGSHRIGRPVPAPPPLEDRDRDGIPPPADCDDTNSTIWPGAREIPGNGLDDDCAGGDRPGRLFAVVSSAWAVKRVNVSVVRLQVRDAPPGARIVVRCLGRRCRFGRREAVANANGAAALGRRIRRRMRPGNTLEVRVTAPHLIGKVVRYAIRRGRVPRGRTLCLPPGAAKPSKC